MIGNFRHGPNLDAVYYLKEHIWPLIREEIPDAQVSIYGAYMPDKLIRLQDEEMGFLLKGHAENISDVFRQARILLAPLRFGAGLKGKLMDAMSFGLPFVTTPVGLEGFSHKKACPGLASHNAAELANKAAILYRDKALWTQVQQNGLEFIRKHFNKDIHTTSLKEAIVALSENLDNIRSSNIMGLVFWHQTLQGTKYMSKWIEEKNKNSLSKP